MAVPIIIVVYVVLGIILQSVISAIETKDESTKGVWWHVVIKIVFCLAIPIFLLFKTLLKLIKAAFTRE